MVSKFPCLSSKEVSLHDMTICVLGITFCSKPQLSSLFVHVVVVVVVVVVVFVFAFLFVVVVLFFFTDTGQDQWSIILIIMCLFTRSSRSIEIGIDLSMDKSIKVGKSDLFGIDSIGQSVKIDYTLVFFIHWFNFIFTDLIHLFNYDRDSSLSQTTMADFGLV